MEFFVLVEHTRFVCRRVDLSWIQFSQGLFDNKKHRTRKIDMENQTWELPADFAYSKTIQFNPYMHFETIPLFSDAMCARCARNDGIFYEFPDIEYVFRQWSKGRQTHKSRVHDINYPRVVCAWWARVCDACVWWLTTLCTRNAHLCNARAVRAWSVDLVGRKMSHHIVSSL